MDANCKNMHFRRIQFDIVNRGKKRLIDELIDLSVIRMITCVLD